MSTPDPDSKTLPDLPFERCDPSVVGGVILELREEAALARVFAAFIDSLDFRIERHRIAQAKEAAAELLERSYLQHRAKIAFDGEARIAKAVGVERTTPAAHTPIAQGPRAPEVESPPDPVRGEHLS